MIANKTALERPQVMSGGGRGCTNIPPQVSTMRYYRHCFADSELHNMACNVRTDRHYRYSVLTPASRKAGQQSHRAIPAISIGAGIDP